MKIDNMKEGLYRGPREDDFSTSEEIKKKKSTKRNIFPDKKKVDNSKRWEETSEYIQRGREMTKKFEIGQREGTWIPHGEYPDLPIMINLMTDTHFGSMAVDNELLKRHIEIIDSTPNFFMVHNGDHVDNFSPKVLPSGMLGNPLPPTMQGKAWADVIWRLDQKSKIGVIGFGNHDDFMMASGHDFYDTYMAQLQCPIFTSGGLLTIIVQGVKYEMGMTHRYWGTSKLNPTNACKRYLEHEQPTADIIFLGHVHQSEGLHFERGGKPRVAVIGGTFKDNDSWARKKGIGGNPGTPGWVVTLWPGKKQMHLFKDIELARDVMLSWISDYERGRVEPSYKKI